MAAMTDSLDPKTLLAAYDSQLRTRDHGKLPEGATVDWDGPVKRTFGVYDGAFLEYRDLAGLDGAELDTFIARQRDFFAARGEKFEWKTRGHDLPADLPERLIAAGFEAEDQETVLVGRAADFASPPSFPVRETTDPEDFEKIAANKAIVWDRDMSWIAPMLRAMVGEQAKIYVAEADNKIVSSAWIRFVPGTEFCGLWGGDTLKEYRGRGIYKSLVAARAIDAVERGYKYLQVDASDNSRPILERLGFVAITTTTPYIWTPSAT